MGPPGEKGSIGFKGNKGNRGLTGIQGPKGECSVAPKIYVFPESQYVFVNRSATFYCWVQGQSVDKISWRKLENDSLRDIRTTNGLLHISNVQKSHTGSYLCAGFTSHGLFQAVVVLGFRGRRLNCCSYFNFFCFSLCSHACLYSSVLNIYIYMLHKKTVLCSFVVVAFACTQPNLRPQIR